MFASISTFIPIFQDTYSVKTTFGEALKLINIEQVGHAHSAIDDARSLAKMIMHLYNRGAAFRRVTDWRYQ